MSNLNGTVRDFNFEKDNCLSIQHSSRLPCGDIRQDAKAATNIEVLSLKKAWYEAPQLPTCPQDMLERTVSVVTGMQTTSLPKEVDDKETLNPCACYYQTRCVLPASCPPADDTVVVQVAHVTGLVVVYYGQPARKLADDADVNSALSLLAPVVGITLYHTKSQCYVHSRLIYFFFNSKFINFFIKNFFKLFYFVMRE